MLKYKIFGAALILSAAIATPALAEVIQERPPSRCAAAISAECGWR